MTRIDIKRCIRLFLDSNYASDNHSECAEKLLSEYEQQIRAEAIDEYKIALKEKIEHECKYLSDGGCTTTEYLDPYYIDTVAERLKEQNKTLAR